MKKTWIIGIVVIVILGLWVARGYNTLVVSRRGIDGAWGQVQVVLQRRADVIAQEVAVVSGSAKFEKSVLLGVTQARAGIT
ncbi:LemA family protein, partial [Candidatus Berkelbacteria bacterium]|nr:LemA family protein [Candidatus Berkelbacteria bacterium]